MEKLMVSPKAQLAAYVADAIDLNTCEYKKTSPVIKFLKKIKWYLIFAIPAQVKWKKFQNERHRVIFGI